MVNAPAPRGGQGGQGAPGAAFGSDGAGSQALSRPTSGRVALVVHGGEGRPFSPSGMEKLFVRLCERTGHYRPGFSIRNLRHTALSALLHEGVDLPSIQAMAGHENLTTTEGYLHIEPRALVNRVRAKNPWDREREET